MQSFAWRRPTDRAAAVAARGAAAEGAYLAGGMTLIPTLKQGLATPTDLVDLSAVAGLAGIDATGDRVTIGAMTTHAEVATSAAVRRAIPALAALAAGIGDRQVRHRGTLGGSLANSDPAADYPAAALALGATIFTDRQRIPADDFFVDLFQTALEDGELIVAVAFPAPRRAAYRKFPNPASRYAMAGVFAAEFASGVRVGVTGAGPCAFRWAALEQALSAQLDPAAARSAAIDHSRFNTDLHATAEYRAQLVRVMAARAVEDLLAA